MGGGVDHSGNVTTSSQIVLPHNRLRSGAIFVNDSDTVIYLGLGYEAAVNKGIRLNPAGGSYEIGAWNLFRGDIHGIHGGSGNKVLCIVEKVGFGVT
jgi:hypothetical protein